MTTVTQQDFLADRTGSRYADVAKNSKTEFAKTLTFFSDAGRQQRMVEAEIHHDRPALAGVVLELEYEKWFDDFMRSNDGHDTYRLRQAIGVLVRMIMESLGFKTTGRKGSLGQRAKAAAGDTTPGAYHNTGGLSMWFTRAERYERPGGNPYKPASERTA